MLPLNRTELCGTLRSESSWRPPVSAVVMWYRGCHETRQVVMRLLLVSEERAQFNNYIAGVVKSFAGM